MQAVLCAGLGATVALAMWVDRSRAASLAVAFGPVQNFDTPLYNLNLRLPEGFRPEVRYDANLAFVRLIERVEHFDRHRTLTVLLTELPRGSRALPTAEDAAIDVLDKSVLLGRRPEGPARSIDLLGVHGALLAFPAEQFVDPETGQRKERFPVLAVSAVLPQARIVVVVYLFGVQNFASADYDLIRTMATSLSPVDPAHPAPPLPESAAKTPEVEPASPRELPSDDDSR